MPGTRQPASRRVRRRASLILIVASMIISLAAVTAGPAAAAKGGRPTSLLGQRAHPTKLINHGRSTLAQAAALGKNHPRGASPKLPQLKVPFKGPKSGPKPARTGKLMAPATLSSSVRPLIVSAAPPAVPKSFEGLSNADNNPALEPPDPWVAVNGTHVIQIVNSLVRVSTRAGATLETLPTWALFSLPNGQFGTDGRIIWDAFHGRWVGILTSFDGTITTNYLNLIVSETADPLGAWESFAIPFNNDLPDFPGIASSTDRIVIAVDDFVFPANTFLGPDVLIIPWSAILAGTSLTAAVLLGDASIAHMRPAQVLSPSADVHLIYELLSTGDVYYARISGSATAPTVAIAVDLTTSAMALPPFSLPVDPHNADGTTISNAVDERPTDAVWRGGHLWFTSTYASGGVDVARVTQLNVTTSVPTLNNDFSHSVGGADLWTPGIGVTGDGTAIAVMTASVVGAFDPMTIASRWSAVDGWNTFYDIYDQSDGPYTGTRWGDFVGVAADPAASDSVWASDETATSDGDWRTTVFQFTAPAIATAPVQSVFVPSTLPSFNSTTPQSVPVKVSWTASTAGATGATFDVEENIDGAGFVPLYTRTAATNLTLSLQVGHTYQFGVRAVNGNFEPGAFVSGVTFTPTVYQQTTNIAAAKVVYSGSWSSSSSSPYSGGSVKYASVAGRSATFTATGARAIAIVTDKASSRGSFKVYVDGVLKGTISTYSTTTRYRQNVFQFSWPTAGTHSVKIVVSGTHGHPRVDLDAFVVLK